MYIIILLRCRNSSSNVNKPFFLYYNLIQSVIDLIQNFSYCYNTLMKFINDYKFLIKLVHMKKSYHLLIIENEIYFYH